MLAKQGHASKQHSSISSGACAGIAPVCGCVVSVFRIACAVGDCALGRPSIALAEISRLDRIPAHRVPIRASSPYSRMRRVLNRSSCPDSITRRVPLRATAPYSSIGCPGVVRRALVPARGGRRIVHCHGIQSAEFQHAKGTESYICPVFLHAKAAEPYIEALFQHRPPWSRTSVPYSGKRSPSIRT